MQWLVGHGHKIRKIFPLWNQYTNSVDLYRIYIVLDWCNNNNNNKAYVFSTSLVDQLSIR